MSRSRPEISPPEITQARWERFLAVWDYKPGWRFEYVPAHLSVCFKMMVHDTFAPRELKSIIVTTEYTIWPEFRTDQFTNARACDFMRDCIQLIECHEADEWMRFDGIQVFNPHGPPQHLGRRVEGWEWMGPACVEIAPTLPLKEDHASARSGDVPGLQGLPEPERAVAE